MQPHSGPKTYTFVCFSFPIHTLNIHNNNNNKRRRTPTNVINFHQQTENPPEYQFLASHHCKTGNSSINYQ
uniref:Uncharacterized protein n=1 Tax=Glycine max TaxID=3847 RepID=K7MQP1_SOYBN